MLCVIDLNSDGMTTMRRALRLGLLIGALLVAAAPWGCGETRGACYTHVPPGAAGGSTEYFCSNDMSESGCGDPAFMVPGAKMDRFEADTCCKAGTYQIVNPSDCNS